MEEHVKVFSVEIFVAHKELERVPEEECLNHDTFVPWKKDVAIKKSRFTCCKGFYKIINWEIKYM